MKLREMFKCLRCGLLVPVTQALEPPKDGKPAEPKPCACGAIDWVPVKR